VKPFRERNPIVLGVIGLVVLAGLVYAAFNAGNLPLIGGGDSYSAAFSDASGLQPDNEVRIAGVKVGKVTGVSLETLNGKPQVRVDFRVDHGVNFGTRTEATIEIKTVLGQKYLGLDPAGPGRMQPGQQIPRSRTSSPFDVVNAVNGLASTVDKIDTKQLSKAFDVLAETLNDVAPNVKGSLTGLSRLSDTVASRDAELRELLRRARNVTQVLADRDKEFVKLLKDGNKLLAEVKARRTEIHTLLVATRKLANQLSGLVSDNEDQLQPALKELRGVVSTLQSNSDNLTASIKNLAPFLEAFTNVVGNGRWFDSYIDALLQPYLPGAPPAVPASGDASGAAINQKATASPSTSPRSSPSASPSQSSASPTPTASGG
jgi:phospholipid/cholesterol/gamma-HCH transport system substrate-binding protein